MQHHRFQRVYDVIVSSLSLVGPTEKYRYCSSSDFYASVGSRRITVPSLGERVP